MDEVIKYLVDLLHYEASHKFFYYRAEKLEHLMLLLERAITCKERLKMIELDKLLKASAKDVQKWIINASSKELEEMRGLLEFHIATRKKEHPDVDRVTGVKW